MKYMNIYRYYAYYYGPPDKREELFYIFLFLDQNVCCRYSKEQSYRAYPAVLPAGVLDYKIS